MPKNFIVLYPCHVAGDRGGSEAVSAGDEVDGDELHADHHRDTGVGVRGELETNLHAKFHYHGGFGPSPLHHARAIGLKGLGGVQPPPGKIIQLVGMKIEPLSAQE